MRPEDPTQTPNLGAYFEHLEDQALLPGQTRSKTGTLITVLDDECNLCACGKRTAVLKMKFPVFTVYLCDECRRSIGYAEAQRG